jgi:hypothetical protein
MSRFVLQVLSIEEQTIMIQAIYKGIEIEMEMHQQAHDYWKCDYTLIKHPGRTETLHHGDKEFPTMELAKEYALQEARDAIDRGALSS